MVTVWLKCFNEIEKVLILGVGSVSRKLVPGSETELSRVGMDWRGALCLSKDELRST